jgi:hypothetical protein
MKFLTLSALALALLMSGCTKTPEATIKTSPDTKRAAGIDWIRPETLAEVDRAFVSPTARNQPAFLFWTAAWSPPCNQVKGMIFTRADFIGKSHSFVPVYVDADRPSGQVLGQCFNVYSWTTADSQLVLEKDVPPNRASCDGLFTPGKQA